MNETRRLLQHFLAALAYRTQKALRDAPDGFGEFRAGTHVRTPHELVWHMTGVIGYARTMLHGGMFAPPRLATFAEEIRRFHDVLGRLRDDFANADLEARISDEQFLQGPLADAMTHAGQLAMLRRLAGSPVPSENFIHAGVDAANVSAEQPMPAAPDPWWHPDQPPQPPAPEALQSVAGLFYHGTRADLRPGDLIVPGSASNYTDRRSPWVYFSATVDAATWGAELARGDGRERIYIVDPTGPFDDDPNLTDKKFPGNPTRSYRSREPLRIVAELDRWQGHGVEAVMAMKSAIAGLEPIDD